MKNFLADLTDINFDFHEIYESFKEKNEDITIVYAVVKDKAYSFRVI